MAAGTVLAGRFAWTEGVGNGTAAVAEVAVGAVSGAPPAGTPDAPGALVVAPPETHEIHTMLTASSRDHRRDDRAATPHAVFNLIAHPTP